MRARDCRAGSTLASDGNTLALPRVDAEVLHLSRLYEKGKITMPTYRYTARTVEGQKETGLLSARDTEDLRTILRYKGLYLIRSDEHSKEKGVLGFFNLLARRTRG